MDRETLKKTLQILDEAELDEREEYKQIVNQLNAEHNRIRENIQEALALSNKRILELKSLNPPVPHISREEKVRKNDIIKIGRAITNIKQDIKRISPADNVSKRVEKILLDICSNLHMIIQVIEED